MQSEPEVLDQEPAARAPRWVWVTLAVAVVIGGLAWGVDEYQRSREHTAVTECRDGLLTADRDAATRLSRVAEYIHPAIVSLPADQASRLAEPMQSPARIALPSVQAAVESCQEVTVWSWHQPDRRRIEGTVAYADALLAHLRRITQHGSVYFDSDEQLDRLRAGANLS